LRRTSRRARRRVVAQGTGSARHELPANPEVAHLAQAIEPDLITGLAAIYAKNAKNPRAGKRQRGLLNWKLSYLSELNLSNPIVPTDRP
jgi:hypothetical protein